MRRKRKIKILATLGPSSNTPETIEQLFRAGADIFRINMSHTSHAAMRGLVKIIRGVEAKCDRPIGILADLQGPKLRLGNFEHGSVELARGQTFTLDSDAAPVPPSVPAITTAPARAFATPAAIVPTPTSLTSFTLTRACGFTHVRS